MQQKRAVTVPAQHVQITLGLLPRANAQLTLGTGKGQTVCFPCAQRRWKKRQGQTPIRDSQKHGGESCQGAHSSDSSLVQELPLGHFLLEFF